MEPLVKPGEGKENLGGERTMRTGLNKTPELEITPHFTSKTGGGGGLVSEVLCSDCGTGASAGIKRAKRSQATFSVPMPADLFKGSTRNAL